jgi:hypothetical protein
MSEALSWEHVLKQARCWEKTDRVGGPDVTRYRQRLRLRQARWREKSGYPIGHQPIHGGPGAKELGSRIDLCFARNETPLSDNPGLPNLISENAKGAAVERVRSPQPHQMLATARLWADLLSSMPLCFNLFGELLSNGRPNEWSSRAATALGAAEGSRVLAIHFEWSPGRLDPLYLGNRSAFDVAFDLRAPDGERELVGVEVKYHEHTSTERRPNPKRLKRYEQVANQSEAIGDDEFRSILGTGRQIGTRSTVEMRENPHRLQQLLQDHLLALSIRLHPNREWGRTRFVLLYPSENVTFARAAEDYVGLLRGDHGFHAVTLESVLTSGALPSIAIQRLRERYLDPLELSTR